MSSADDDEHTDPHQNFQRLQATHAYLLTCQKQGWPAQTAAWYKEHSKYVSKYKEVLANTKDRDQTAVFVLNAALGAYQQCGQFDIRLYFVAIQTLLGIVNEIHLENSLSELGL
jgi:hypothetical protein